MSTVKFVHVYIFKSIIIFIFLSLLSIQVHAEDDNKYEYKYSFWKKLYIHPKIIQDLSTWLSDGGDQVVAINLSDSQNSNRYFGEIKVQNIAGEMPYIFVEGKKESFGYQYIGKTNSGIYILYTSDWGGGSGIFKSLMLVTIEKDLGISFDENKNSIQMNRQRIVIKKLGEIVLGDRYKGKLKVKGNTLLIGKDLGWFSDNSKKDKIIKININR